MGEIVTGGGGSTWEDGNEGVSLGRDDEGGLTMWER